MKFKGFAEFGLLLASFSYALEKMVEEGELNLNLERIQSLPSDKEETFDDIIAEFEKLEKEAKHISNFIEPVLKEEIKEDKPELTEEMIQAAVEAKLEEETVDSEDLAVVNELRKRILDAFKERESESIEVFETEKEAEEVSEDAPEEISEETIEEVSEDDSEDEYVYDPFDLYQPEDKVERFKTELINNFDEYIADIKNVYGKQSRITKAIDSMVEHDTVMKDIKKLYPNLEDAFINEYYRLKDAINSENVEGKKGIILHRLSFNDKNDLLGYANHIMAEGMVVNVNETKLIVDVIRPIVTKNGKVMQDIFKVANTAAAFGGFYVGYLVK